jgi:LysR family transcriptional regulator, glycine cleavage system transcriptional activator
MDALSLNDELNSYEWGVRMRRIPSFALLRAFEAAARLMSFSRAAEELSLSASAISHEIGALEKYFEKRLFRRHHRRVDLTHEGRRLYESLGRVMDALEISCGEVSLAPSDQVLTVHCSPSFAAKCLGPRMADFWRAHPDVTIRLTCGAEPIDLTALREVDVLISYGYAVSQPGIDVTALGRERVAPMCSPIMSKRGKGALDVILRNTLIDSQLSPLGWREWFQLNELALPARARPSFDRAALAIAAATDGMGVVLESTRLAERELRRRELVILGDEMFTRIERPLHFFSQRSSARASPKVTMFRDWLYLPLNAAAPSDHTQVRAGKKRPSRSSGR